MLGVIGGGGTPDAPAPDDDAPVGMRPLELLFTLFTDDETSLSGDVRAADGDWRAVDGRSVALDGDRALGGRGKAPTRGGVGGSLLAGLILAVGGGVPGGSADGERGCAREGADDAGEGIPDGARERAVDGRDGALEGERVGSR